jgi:hypothetical protein
MDRAEPHCANRIFEWVAALMLFGIAFTLALPGDTLEKGQFKYLIEVGFNEAALAVFMSCVASVRLVSLYLNGRWPVYGARCRSIGAMFGAIVWSQMWFVILLHSMAVGVPSLGVPIYGFLALGEMLSCYRATYDAGRTSC